MIKILAVSIVSVLLISFLKQYKSDYVIVFKIAVITVIAFITMSVFRESGFELSVFEDLAFESPSYLSIVIKTLGIVIVTQVASNLCKESGEESISLLVELVGKISVLIICNPLIEMLYQLIKGYLEI